MFHLAPSFPARAAVTYSPVTTRFGPSTGLRFGDAFPAAFENDTDCVPTPRSVVLQMIRSARIEPGMSVLEPSAGTGNIAKCLQNLPGVDFYALERAASLRKRLAGKGMHMLPENDFLAHHAKYDRIIMNPPFSQGQCFQHVRHAYALLKPDGVVASIVPWYVLDGSSKRSRSFLRWLQTEGKSADIQAVSPQSFVNAESRIRKPLRTYIVTIRKPGETSGTEPSGRGAVSPRLDQTG